MKIFISFAHEDRSFALGIAKRLKIAGHDVNYDIKSLRTGDNIFEKINEGLKTAEVLLIIFSKNAMQSKWVMKEYSAIAFEDLNKKKNRIIPIKIDTSPIPQYLARSSSK